MNSPITLKNISLTGRLDDVTVTLPEPGITCLLGANGAGKSSLLMVLAGLVAPDSGTVHWGDSDVFSATLFSLSAQRCYVAQQQNIQFALTGRECLQYLSAGHGQKLPGELLNKLDISVLLERPVSQMSGGEFQRIMISRALLQVWPAIQSGRAIIVMDEPLQALDIRHQTVFMRWMTQLVALGNHIIMSCHDINIAKSFADTVWLAKSGKLLASGNTAEVLTLSNLWLTFGCQFECVVKEQQHYFFPKEK